MTYSNDPKATTIGRQESPIRNTKNWIIGILSFLLLSTGGYLFADKTQSKKVIQQQETKLVQITDEKSQIQLHFDQSLVRLDSMTGINADLNKTLSEQNKEIAKTKNEIRSILNKKNASAAELSRAKELIVSLNQKITGMEQDIARLTQDNQTLTIEKTVLIQEKEKLNQELVFTTSVKEDLTKKVDIGSTLYASNISIMPVNVKRNEKEKTTTTAKRIDKLVISFEVNNRITASGTTDVYICIINPDGKLIATEALGSGTFTSREEGTIPYTTKVAVDIETANKKWVEFSFNPGEAFQQGNYKIHIYQNGFLIGEGTSTLKKGGLFS